MSNAREKEGHFMMIKGPITQEDISTINILAPKQSFKIHEGKTDIKDKQTPPHS